MRSGFSNAGILSRMVESAGRSLQPEVAAYFLGLSLTEPDSHRIAELSEKANEGLLSADERDELGLYVLLSDFIAVMQSHARASLKSRSPAV